MHFTARLTLTTAAAVAVAGTLALASPARAQAVVPTSPVPGIPGPLEARAVPVTAENPIPARTKTVAADYPGNRRAQNVRGTVTLRVTLDERGRVAETRRPFTPDLSVVQVEGTRYAVGAPLGDDFVNAAVRAVREWEYQPPRQAPIAFYVRLLFSPSESTAVLWHSADRPPMPEPRPGGVAGGAAGNTPPPPPPTRAPVRVGGTVTQPKKIRDAVPVYPMEAQAARIEGRVVLEVTIAGDGRVTDARVLQSIPLLDRAAIDAVRQWEFTPTLLNGVPTPILMTVTINFTLGK